MFQRAITALTFRRSAIIILSVLLPMSLAAATPAAAASQAKSQAKSQAASKVAAVKAAAQELTWTAGDDITRYRSTPTQAVAGETTIVFENSAATGNTTGMPHTLTFDTTTAGYNHDVNLNVLASPFDANNGRQQQTVTLTPGRYRYFCSIPGHSTMVGELVVTEGGADTTPPTVSANVTGTKNPDGDYIGAATVSVDASDAESGVDTVEYQIDDTSFQPYTAPIRITTIGDHAVQFRASDKAGNTSQIGSVSLRVVAPPDPDDTTAPTVTAGVTGDKDPAGNYIGAATVTLTATDTQSGVATVEYALNDAAFVPYNRPIVVNQVGMHMVHFRATDVAGNVSPEGMVHITVVAPQVEDTTPPTVSSSVAGERDTNGQYIDTATITVNATDTQSGIETVQYSLDGQAFVTYTAPVAVNSVGAHTVRYRATDKAGNTSPEGTTAFTVVRRPDPDTTAPETSAVLSGNRDTNGSYLGSATVTVTATDAQSGIRSIELAVGGGDWLAYTGPVTIRTPGAHTVRYRATDVALNVSAEKTVSFTVVASGADACPDSDSRDTVIIGADDTLIDNVDTGNGCTINDLIAERAQYLDHGSFVRHVDAVTNSLVEVGTLTRRQQSTIVRAAARSDVGK